MKKNKELQKIVNETLLETITEFKSHSMLINNLSLDDELDITNELENIEFQNKSFIKQLHKFQCEVSDNLTELQFDSLGNLINSMILQQSNISLLLKLALEKEHAIK